METPGTATVPSVITIDPSVSTTPCVNIREVNAMQNESEILFFVYSVFRIESIDSVPMKIRIYRVQLKLSSDNDQQLHCIIKGFNKDMKGTEG
jgi:hypothetical protein